mgnify:CR=1 FL=1
MRKFRLPPLPVAVLAFLALLAVPLMWLYMLPYASSIACLQMLSSEVPAMDLNWLERAAVKVRAAKYTPEQRLILGLAGDPGVRYDLDYLDRLAVARPESLVIQTRWTLKQLSRKGDKPLVERLAWIDKIEKTDPENSLWPLMRAHVLMDDAAKIEDLELPADAPKGTPAPQKLAISNQAQFDQGIAELRRGLAMPKYEARVRDLIQMQIDAFGQVRNLSDSIALIGLAAANLLPDLQMLRNTQRFALQYGRQLLEQGKVEEARPLLRSWLPLAEKQLNSGDDTLIGALVTGAMFRGGETEEMAWRKAARSAEADQAAALWKPLVEPINAFKKANKENRQNQKFEEFGYKGGILPSLLLPALGQSSLPPLEEAFAWRQLEYVQFAEMGLLMTWMMAVWLGLLIGLLVYGFRQAPATTVPYSWVDFCRLAFWCLLPLALYRLFERGYWAHEALCPGKQGMLVHYCVGIAVLLLALLLALALPHLCYRSWRNLPGRWLEMLSVLILAGCAMVLVSTTIEAPRLVQKAKFMQISSAGFTQVEAEVTQKLKTEMRQAVEANKR